MYSTYINVSTLLLCLFHFVPKDQFIKSVKSHFVGNGKQCVGETATRHFYYTICVSSTNSFFTEQIATIGWLCASFKIYEKKKQFNE